MPTPVISTIKSLKNAAVFLDIPPPNEGVTFLRYNLIYGFNGSGKTSLSRLFEALREGGDRSNLSDNCDCTFVLSNGANVTLAHDPSQTEIGSKIAVFNEDFVERSLTWKSGSALPIVYIGALQAETADRIEKSETLLVTLRAEDTLKASEWSNASKALSSLKTDLARLVANELNLGRSYTAAQLKADYDSQAFTMDSRLSAEKITEFKELINRPSVPNLSLPVLPNDVAATIELVSSCLESTVEKVAIASLERRADALPWVTEGIELHAEESECLFCGQGLPSERLVQLTSALGHSFSKLMNDIAAASDTVGGHIQKLRAFREALPASYADALPSYRDQLANEAEAARKLASALERVFERWQDQLIKKGAQANERITLDGKPNDPTAAGVEKAQGALSDLEARHNLEVGEYGQLSKQAKQALKAHHLAGSDATYREAIETEKATMLASSSAAQARQAENVKLQALKAELKEHAPAAGELNVLLRSYLGHGGITMKVTDDGYTICRGGKVATKPLSEGEKTAVAFCYFLTSLNAEGKKTEDLIIVVDDPISSLDTRSMTFVFALVKSRLEKAAQLFILTHNLDFMRENKKWLNKRYRHEEVKTAEFLFVECFNSPDGKRQARLTGLPSLISEYDSEYHYLYSLIDGLSKEPAEFERFQYLMPNAIRKVLEIFLSFKLPGSTGLGDKINQVVRLHPDLDECKIRSMEHLAQLESHSENIGDVITFSGFTLEQVREAADTLLEMIGKMDKAHGDQMAGLSRKGRVKANVAAA